MKHISIHALDALRQLLLDPLTRPHWDHLLKQYNETNDQAFRTLAVEKISAHLPQTGLVGFYRGVFLAHILAEEKWKQDAAIALLGLRPVNVDRIMSFLSFENAVSIYESQANHGLNTRAEKLKFPQLIELATDAITLKAKRGLDPNSKRIAVYSMQINDGRHPPTNLLFDHAHLLKSLGYEVHVFSAQELDIPQSNHYLSNCGYLVNWPFDPRLQYDAGLAQSLDVTLASSSLSLLTRYEQMITKIIEFAPSLIFFVGDGSPLIEFLFQKFPVIGLSTNSNMPMGHSDLWLAANQKHLSLTQLGNTTAFHYPHRIKDPAQTQRSEVRTRSSKVVLVTVGSRLAVEIRDDWAKKMLAVVDSHPQLEWKLVGGQGVLPEALAAANERITAIPFTPNVAEHLASADIYVNPRRVGGGFSVAEAMAFSLPVLSYSETDGGDKLLEHAVDTDQAYFDLLTHLVHSREDRIKFGAQLREMFDQNLSLSNAAPRLRLAIQQATQNALRRLSKKIESGSATDAKGLDSPIS